MAGEIAQAFVRIRPNTAGFQAETESGVKSALVNVGKIAAGFFALRGIVDEFKNVANAAAEHQSAFAVLDQTIKNAGASTHLFGTNIEAVLEKEAKLKGFTETDLAAGFTKLVGVTKSSATAFKDLSLVEDISRARHIDVQTAALSLSRALQGSTTSLSRLGIVIPKVTAAQTALRAEHERLIASGVKFSGAVKQQYDVQLAAAKASDAQATRLNALTVVQDRFGGSAKAFANSAAGQFQRFDVSVKALEVSIGKVLLPTLASATETVTHWVDELASSERVHDDVAAGVSFVRNAFEDVKSVIETLAPELRLVQGILGELSNATGLGGILALVVGFKGAKIAIDLFAGASRQYLALQALGGDADAKAALQKKAVANASVLERAALESTVSATEADAAAANQASVANERYAAALKATGSASAEAGLVATTATTTEATAATERYTAALLANAEARSAQGPAGSTISADAAATTEAAQAASRYAAASLELATATDAKNAGLAAESKLLAADAAATARATAEVESYTVALRANAGALGAGAEAAQAQAAVGAAAATENRRLAEAASLAAGVTAAEEVTASTEALGNLGKVSSDASKGIVETTTAYGDLGVTADSATHLLDRAGVSAEKAAEKTRLLKSANQSAAASSEGLATAQRATVAASAEQSTAIAGQAAAAGRLGVAQKGLGAATAVGAAGVTAGAVGLDHLSAAATEASSSLDGSAAEVNTFASGIHHTSEVLGSAKQRTLDATRSTAAASKEAIAASEATAAGYAKQGAAAEAAANASLDAAAKVTAATVETSAAVARSPVATVTPITKDPITQATNLRQRDLAEHEAWLNKIEATNQTALAAEGAAATGATRKLHDATTIATTLRQRDLADHEAWLNKIEATDQSALAAEGGAVTGAAVKFDQATAQTVEAARAQSKAFLETARAAQVGSAEQVAAYEASARAATHAAALSQAGIAPRPGALIGGETSAALARRQAAASVQIARANAAGSERQIAAYEKGIAGTLALTGATEKASVAAVGHAEAVGVEAEALGGAAVAQQAATGTLEEHLAAGRNFVTWLGSDVAALEAAGEATDQLAASNARGAAAEVEAAGASQTRVAAATEEAAAVERLDALTAKYYAQLAAPAAAMMPMGPLFAKDEAAIRSRAKALAEADLAAEQGGAKAAAAEEGAARAEQDRVAWAAKMVAASESVAAASGEEAAALGVLAKQNFALVAAEATVLKQRAASFGLSSLVLSGEDKAAVERRARILAGFEAKAFGSAQAELSGLNASASAGAALGGARTEAAATSGALASLSTAARGVGAGIKAVGTGLLAFVGGLPTLFAGAIAFLGFLTFKAVTASTALEQQSDRLGDSLVALGKDVETATAATKALGDAQSSLQTNRIQVEEAKLGLARSQTALSTSNAIRGTSEYQGLVVDLANSQDQLRQAEHQVSQTEDEIAAQRAKRAEAEKRIQANREDSLKRTLKLTRDIRTNAPPPAVKGVHQEPFGGPSLSTVIHPVRTAEGVGAVFKDFFDTRTAVEKFVDSINREAKKLDKEGFPIIARHLRDLAALTKATDKLPKDRVVKLLFSTNALDAAKAVTAVSAALERNAHSVSDFVASLDKERRAVLANDPALAKRLGLIENLQRATGRKLPPQVIQLILHENATAGLGRIADRLRTAHVSLGAFVETLRRESHAFEETNPKLNQRIIILNQFAQLVGRIPTRQEKQLVLRAPNALAAITALQNALGKMKTVAGRSGAEAGKEFFTRLANIPAIDKALSALGSNVGRAIASATNQKLLAASVSQLQGQLATAKQVVDTARQGVESAQQSLADARQTLADSQASLAQTIKQGQQQVNDSLKSAGSNLISLGSSLADSISKFFDAQTAKGQSAAAPSGPLAARLRELEKLIQEGKGTPAIIAKAQEVEAELNAQAAKDQGTTSADKRKERVQRRLADLTDEFNTGKISLAQFNRGVLALLKKEGVNYKNAGRLLGVAFADGFKEQLIQLRQQAAAISKFGRRPGLAALGGTIEKPAEVRSAALEADAKAQREVSKAQESILKDIRQLHAKERTLQQASAKADRLREKIHELRAPMQRTAEHTAALVRQNAELLKLARQRASNAAFLPSGAVVKSGFGGIGVFAPSSAATDKLRHPIEEGLRAKSGSEAAKRAGREIIRDFQALGGSLGDGIRLGLKRGERKFFQELEDLLLGGHRHGKKTTRSGSPSLLFAEHGDDLVGGLVLGLARSRPRLSAEIAKLLAPGHFSLRETIDALVKRASAPGRIGGQTVRQTIALLREVKAAPFAFPRVPATLPPAGVRQAIHLLRELFGGNIASLLARAERQVPHSLSARSLRQRIDVTRHLVERESAREIIARAEKLGNLARGHASLTVVVGANVRPARAALDALRQEAERRATAKVTPKPPPRAATLLSPIPRPPLPPPLPRAAAALDRAAVPPPPRRSLFPGIPLDAARGIEPLRQAVADRQRGTLIGEERKQTKLLGEIYGEERKQTVLLRKEVGVHRFDSPHKKNPRRATQDATATAIHNLLGS